MLKGQKGQQRGKKGARESKKENLKMGDGI